MSNAAEKTPVLDFIVNTLKNAIADAKVTHPEPGTCILKDGNDEIILVQEPAKANEGVIIRITDKRRIIFSEDLLETLQYLHQDVEGNDKLKAAIRAATMLINGLDIETELIFQAVKDLLDQVSNSYEFLQTVELNVNVIGAGFKFGQHIFRLNITNAAEQVTLEPRFTATFDPLIQQTITADIAKVQKAVNNMFKSA